MYMVAIIDWYSRYIVGFELSNTLDKTFVIEAIQKAIFYVDKTKPSIEENFATFTNEATNNSFNTDKTAVIKITEHNFDPQLAGFESFQKGFREKNITKKVLLT